MSPAVENNPPDGFGTQVGSPIPSQRSAGTSDLSASLSLYSTAIRVTLLVSWVKRRVVHSERLEDAFA